MTKAIETTEKKKEWSKVEKQKLKRQTKEIKKQKTPAETIGEK